MSDPAEGPATPHATEPLRQLIAAQLPMLEQLVRRSMSQSLRDRQSASDVVQSVCADLCRDDVAFEYRGPAQFHEWLTTIVRNKLRARLRRDHAGKRDVRRLQHLSESRLDATRAGADSPSGAALLQEDLGMLDRALALLSAADRDLLVRRHLRGHSRERIALELGIASGLNNRLARAKARLAQALDRLSHDSEPPPRQPDAP